jgi:hypothetical protein
MMAGRLKRAVALRRQGLSYSETAAKMNITRAQVRYALRQSRDAPSLEEWETARPFARTHRGGATGPGRGPRAAPGEQGPGGRRLRLPEKDLGRARYLHRRGHPVCRLRVAV